MIIGRRGRRRWVVGLEGLDGLQGSGLHEVKPGDALKGFCKGKGFQWAPPCAKGKGVQGPLGSYSSPEFMCTESSFLVVLAGYRGRSVVQTIGENHTRALFGAFISQN